MGFLRWIRSQLSPDSSTVTPTLSGATLQPNAAPRPTGSIPFTNWSGFRYLGVVGESQYQDALRQISRAGCICEATLVPEPENPFDVNAVVVKIDELVVGYLPRSHARKYQRRLLALTEPYGCPAKLIGGTADKPNFGVLLDTRVIEHMPTPKRPRKKKQTIDPTETPF